MSDTMAHDRMTGGGDPDEVRPGAGMPASHGSLPVEKPEGALLKSPEEKGTQPNRNRFVAPGNEADKRPTH